MLISALFFVLTVGLYFGNRRLHRAYSRIWFAPAVLTPAVLIGMMLLGGVSYDTYFADTRWLFWMMGPATVAFAVPIYENRDMIVRHWRALACGTLAGCFTAVATSFVFAHLLRQSPEIANSLLTRSISTPFALAVSPTLGGTRELAAIFVVFTGLAGTVLGDIVLTLLPLRSHLAHGALYGASCHAFGAAKANAMGEREGVVASLVMMFSGLLMVLLAPVLGRVLG